MNGINFYRIKYKNTYGKYWKRNLYHYPLFVLLMSSIVFVCIYFISSVTLLELILIPTTFLISNFVEYIMHRFPMHRPYNFLKKIYHKHTINHHLYFREENMYIEEKEDLSAIPVPWETASIFLLFIALPLSILCGFILTTNAGLIFLSTAISYYLVYETMHLLIHTSKTINKIFGVNHTIHHNTRYMRNYNFNVIFPICDVIFGTYKRYNI